MGRLVTSLSAANPVSGNVKAGGVGLGVGVGVGVVVTAGVEGEAVLCASIFGFCPQAAVDRAKDTAIDRAANAFHFGLKRLRDGCSGFKTESPPMII